MLSDSWLPLSHQPEPESLGARVAKDRVRPPVSFTRPIHAFGSPVPVGLRLRARSWPQDAAASRPVA